MPVSMEVETLIIDDCSKEDIRDVAERFNTRYYRLMEHKGPAFARNTGAEKASGDILLFLDSDTIYVEGILEHVHECFVEDPDLAAISFLNQNYRREDGMIRNYSASYEHYFFQRLRASLPDNIINGFSTRNGAVKKDVFIRLNGYDTTFQTNAMEDYDFSCRIGKEYKTILLESPHIYHYSTHSLTGILRNWFIRTALFVPYYLRNKPALDRSQVSGTEIFLRILETLTLMFFCASFLYPAKASLTMPIAVTGFVLVFLGLHDYLHTLKTWSSSWKFCCIAYCIHVLSSVAVVAGGVWGLLSYLASFNSAGITVRKHNR
jgi:glycosyltransferase involved in cell wall biosynthesis